MKRKLYLCRPNQMRTRNTLYVRDGRSERKRVQRREQSGAKRTKRAEQSEAARVKRTNGAKQRGCSDASKAKRCERSEQSGAELREGIM